MKFKNGKKRLGLKRGMPLLLGLLLIFGALDPQAISASAEENTLEMTEAVDQLTKTPDTTSEDAKQADEAEDDNMDGTTPDYTLIQPLAEEGTDVSDKIYFSDGELSNESEVIDHGGDLEVGYWETYTFRINWIADTATVFASGDYFTFEVPKIFAPQNPITITGLSGEDWGTITFADIGNGIYRATAVFNDSVSDLAHLSGYLELNATYKETKDGEPIEWIFTFVYSDEIDDKYKYEGETGIPPQEIKDKTTDIFKAGDFNDDDCLYNWRVIINESNTDWGGDFVKLTDTLGVGHEMAPLTSGTISEPGYFGNDADPADSNVYFGIYVVDWNTMRDDFNTKWGANGEYTLLYKETGDSQYLPQVKADEPVYEFYQDEDGNIIDIPSGMVTNFMMYEMFGTWIDGTGYKYLHLYDESTDGAIETKLTSDGFEIYFPNDSYTDESIFISYNTKLTAKTSIDRLENTVVVEGEKTIEYTASVSETSGKAGIKGEKGHLLLVKADTNENASLAGAVFEFNGNGITVPMTATTNSSGVIDFDFTYIPSYEGTYILKEITPPDGYSTAFEDITIELNSDGEIIAVNGEDVSDLTNGVLEIGRVDPSGLVLVVYNNRIPPSIELSAEKELQNATLNDGDFTFTLTEVNGSYTDSKTNVGKGVTFDSITYPEVEATYTYIISEESGTISNIDYDPSIYTVTVKVEKQDNGVFKAVIESITKKDSDGNVSTESDIKFVNVYTSNESEISTNAKDKESINDAKQSEKYLETSKASKAVSTGDNNSILLICIAMLASAGIFIWYFNQRASQSN